MNKLFKFSLSLLFVAVVLQGCESFLEPSVDQQVPTDQAIKTIGDLQGMVLGAHDILNSAVLFGRDIHVGPDVMSDNAFSNSNSNRFVFQSQFNFVTTNAYSAGIWNNLYRAIALANIVINNTSGLSGAQYDHVVGQAYAIRAFSHMYLLKFFGQQWVTGGDPNNGVPYTTSYAQGNNYPARDPIATVWTNIGEDFNEATTLLNPATIASGTINWRAVKGLQSRYYLYTGQFDLAIAAADAVINLNAYTITPAAGLAAAWASGTGPNSLFEMVYISTDNPGFDSMSRILRATNYGDVEATADLYNAYDAADARRGLFSVTGASNDVYRMNSKYVDELTGTDNVRIIRYEEVLLNKAEALSRRNAGADRAAALTIINDLSAARGSARVYTDADPLTVLAERRLELAMEGHRFFDLARHGQAIQNVPIRVGGGLRFNNNASPIPFGDHRFALPIPNAEINANSNMTQNLNYGS